MTEAALSPIVERLMAVLGVSGTTNEYTQLLAQHISGEGMSAVGMDLICRKLRERAPDPRTFDARYEELKGRNVRELDRTLHLLQKLTEDKAVLTMLSDGSTACSSLRPSAAALPPSGSVLPRPMPETRPLLPHQRSSAAGEQLAVSTEGGGSSGLVLSPASMKQLASLTLTPPSGSRPSPLSGAGGTPLGAASILGGSGAAAAALAIDRAEERGSIAASERASTAQPARAYAPSGHQDVRGLPAASSAALPRANADAPGDGTELGRPIPLGELPALAQEQQLVNDALSALLGIGTDYIVITHSGEQPSSGRGQVI
ncbi:hypothetical protein T492DRAFT_1121145 [Pavlovales sp. CCMP2436]|nr:hypothetical protein T492DRAFT_1121145 [Pavlovales sp. CCMP2436]